EVPLEMRLVDRDILDADRRVVAVDLDDPIYQQERVAVREKLQQPGNIETVQRLRRFLCHRFYFPFLFPSTRLRRAAISRNACLMGWAGEPAHFSPAGMSFITPLPAAICALSPMVM